MRTGPNTRAQQQSWARDSAGVIVTIREQDTSEARTIHRSGLLGDALSDACNAIDNLPGLWLISTISTPRTIAADLAGREATGKRPIALRPEATMLSMIGRLDLLESNHVTTSERGQMSNQGRRVGKSAA